MPPPTRVQAFTADDDAVALPTICRTAGFET